ncbi:hypothetical protein [Glutamicibacter sp. TV12E]|uniref:hypothetical protein n=1 Tax=Glutamicibacter sp. TV12E TaxID=3446362 RepID=UPI0040345665
MQSADNQKNYKRKIEQEMKLFVQYGRLDESGAPIETDVVKFSFGTSEISGDELAWVQKITKGKPSYRTLVLSRETVIGWELAAGNLTEICRTAQEHWDVEVKAVNSSSEKCDKRCREAEGIDCQCACNYKNHGAGVGLAADEIIIGDFIIGTTHRVVTRNFRKIPSTEICIQNED